MISLIRADFSELKLDGLKILVDELFEQAFLDGIQLLAAPCEAPALQGRHLVGELLDLQLPEPFAESEIASGSLAPAAVVIAVTVLVSSIKICGVAVR